MQEWKIHVQERKRMESRQSTAVLYHVHCCPAWQLVVVIATAIW